MSSVSFQQRNKPAARKPREPKIFKIPTAQNLANVALHYLSRYAASAASLQSVLENRIRRAAMTNPAFAADQTKQSELKKIIADIIAKHIASGVLNDSAFATMKISSLRRSGKSTRMITQQLQQKGIDKNIITDALQPEDDTDLTAIERQSAQAFAKRRALGAYRKNSSRKVVDEKTELKKAITTMLRAGFPYAIVKQVLGEEVEEEFFE